MVPGAERGLGVTWRRALTAGVPGLESVGSVVAAPRRFPPGPLLKRPRLRPTHPARFSHERTPLGGLTVTAPAQPLLRTKRQHTQVRCCQCQQHIPLDMWSEDETMAGRWKNLPTRQRGKGGVNKDHHSHQVQLIPPRSTQPAGEAPDDSSQR